MSKEGVYGCNVTALTLLTQLRLLDSTGDAKGHGTGGEVVIIIIKMGQEKARCEHILAQLYL